MFPLSPYGQPESYSPDSNETENYEALLSLAERLGEAKPRGLGRLEIEQLPNYKFNAETHTGKLNSLKLHTFLLFGNFDNFYNILTKFNKVLEKYHFPLIWLSLSQTF